MACPLYAQKVEYSVQINSGLSALHGPGTLSVSRINFVTQPVSYYTGNPHGNIQAATYGIAADLKLVTKRKLLFGLQLGYESLRSKVNLINHPILTDNVGSTIPYAADNSINGYTILTTNFININPFIGYRLNIQHTSIDLTPGLDIAVALNSREEDKAQLGLNSTPDADLTTDNKLNSPSTIGRVRFDAKVNYHRFGIIAGYSRGFIAYKNNGLVTTGQGATATNGSVFDDVFRLGFSYRIK